MCKSCGCSFRARDFGLIERFVEPCILLLLTQDPSHGYGLMEDLEKHCGEKVDIGNLYRTLRRMEALGWIKSFWDKGGNGPKKRVYKITGEGREILTQATSSLVRTRNLINHFLAGYGRLYDERT